MNTNRVNPRKLLHSKWTATQPASKEKHFVVTKVKFDLEGQVIECVIEAVMSKREQSIDWQNLQDSTQWSLGWK